MKVVLIPLAEKKLKQRGIARSRVEETVRGPEQKVPGYGGRMVYQKRYTAGGGKEQLLRVICEEKEGIATVITAYLTSAIERYWRG